MTAGTVQLRSSPVVIVVVGDDQTGKSCLISSFINGTFPEQVQSRLDEIELQVPEAFPDKVPLRLTDTSNDSSLVLERDNAIKKADVIIIVYAVDQPETLARVQSFWLPETRKQGCKVPVLLVGNKIDTREPGANEKDLHDAVMPLMKEYKEIETCVESSARGRQNVEQVFYFAQKAVLHPMAPLYDTRANSLKPACQAALKRIFQACDVDGDGLLNDTELNSFQQTCFATPLSSTELAGVKNVVQENRPEGVKNDSLTLEGFLFLHFLFITRGRLETTWTVLRKFGYNNNVELPDKDMAAPRHNPNVVNELNAQGREFLWELFRKHDLDNDDALSPSEEASLFSTCPRNPWSNTGTEPRRDANGNHTRHGFVTYFSYLMRTNTVQALKYFHYFGCDSPHKYITQVPRKMRRLVRNGDKNPSDTFVAFVFGDTDQGKTALLNGLANKRTDAAAPSQNVDSAGDVNTNSAFNRWVSDDSMLDNSIEENGLALLAIPTADAEKKISNADILSKADAIIMVYDVSNPASAEYLKDLYAKKPKKEYIPVIVVAYDPKGARTVDTAADDSIADFCLNLGIPQAEDLVQPKDKSEGALYNNIMGACRNPSVVTPIVDDVEAEYSRKKTLTLVGGVLAGAVLVGAAAYFVMPSFQKANSSDK
eukprot:GFYU01010250.1.p1 GENE.GFYU01010250.1~~GFYU01010250.1.p1  ORF type:complete len:655 (+),score=100.77 GFYU01010250.1:59-2023(+)